MIITFTDKLGKKHSCPSYELSVSRVHQNPYGKPKLDIVYTADMNQGSEVTPFSIGITEDEYYRIINEMTRGAR